MTEKPPQTPQQKKALSYTKDRRNSFGENDKASRKAIPARKAGQSRKVRRKANTSLKIAAQADDSTVAIIESSLKHDIERVGGWTKSPDVPLDEHIRRQALRRSWRGLPSNRSRKPDADKS